MTPRDYQLDCRRAILETWGEIPSDRDVFRTCVANLTTSAGKTIIAGMLLADLAPKGRCLFMADTDELCAQPIKKFARMRLFAREEKAEKFAPMAARMVVGSAQTLARRVERFPTDHFQYIFVDEAHRGSDRNKKITDHFPAAKICGLTATAFRKNLADLSKYYETVAFELGLFDLVHEGYVTKPTVLTLPVNVDIRRVRKATIGGELEYNADDLDREITPYYERVIELIKEHAPNRQILVFLPLIRSSMVFAEMCQEANLTARHVDGKSRDREEVQEAFARREFQVLCNSSLLSTGWDCQTVDCLLNLVPTRSVGMFRQKVGRIIRVLPGIIDGIDNRDARLAAIGASAKPDALILDLLWQADELGLVGPADLVAANADEKTAIERKMREKRTPEDLEAIAKEVQKEREARLIEELEKAQARAATRRSRFNDTVNSIAAMLHDRNLQQYEPVAAWHKLPVTEKLSEQMVKAGVDPESATDRGHATALVNLLFGRKAAGLCTARAVRALEKKGIVGAISMTEAKAYEILGADYPFPFGKNSMAGRTFGQVRDDYWKWLARQTWTRHSWPIVYAYLRDVKGYVERKPDKEPDMFEVLS